MKNKSLLEDILETAVKNPVAGVILSILFAGLGLYWSNKGAPAGAKPTETAFLPMYHLFGKLSYMASLLVLILAGIGYVAFSAKRKKQEAFFGTRRTLDDIKDLTWKEFEEFVGSLFTKMGYSVEVTGGLDDGGVDLMVKKDGKTSLVQCKNYRVSKVSLSMVRDFYGAMNANLNFEVGYFITTGMFTLEARHFAEDKPIELIDGAKLMDYVRLTSKGDLPSGARTLAPVYSETPQERTSVSSARNPKVPVCPKCGVNMVLRTAKKGDNVGKQFWGCSNYPQCHATKLYNPE